jgi:hypothetical protein
MAIAIDKLTTAGKKAMFALRRRCNDLSITNPEVMCQLFDSFVRPILSYACKVWTGCTGAKGLQQAKQVHSVATPLWPSVGVKSNTWKSWGVLGVIGKVPNVQSSTARGKTPRIGVFLVSLERS